MESNGHGKEFFYKKLLRRSLWVLGISGILNVFAFTYIAIELEDGGVYAPQYPQKGLSLPFEAPKSHNLHRELACLAATSYDDLAALLDDGTPLCDGYKRQDLALSCLVSLHHVHLDRALQSTALQKRIVKVGEQSFRLTPGLTSDDFQEIRTFLSKEEWPFTFHGMLLLLQQKKDAPTLKMAFTQTREYQELLRLLSFDQKIGPDEAFQLIVAADFATQTQLRLAPNSDARRAFLLKLLPTTPQLVAPLLVKHDYRYAVHTLDDQMALLVLKNLQEHPTLYREYALGLLVSPRSDAVWKEVVLQLCELSKLDPEKETRNSLLTRFGILKAKVAKKAVPIAPKKVEPPKRAPIAREVVHIVKSGDSLWALSRKYKVDVQAIKKRNNLQSDALKPGTELCIPISSSSRNQKF